MKAGLVADIVVVLIVVVITAICTRQGFVRCALRLTSTVLALLIAFFTASPLANFLDRKFDLVSKIATWKVPGLTAQTLLSLMVGVGVFIVARLLFILLDKFLQYIKEKVKAVNTVDRVLGTVFGLLLSVVCLAVLFMVTDALSLTAVLQLTPEQGGFFAPYLFNFFKQHIFPLVGVFFGAVSDAIPKV